MFNFDLFFESLPILATAAIVTVQLTVSSAVLSILFGTLSVMLQLSKIPGGYWFSRAYVSIMRGTPLLVQLFVVFFGLPLLGIKGQAFLAAAIAIGLNSGAYTTEILRAAVQNVPSGQIEAARAMGMSNRQIWLRVILPQALVVSLPALTSEFTIVLKSTPLASVVAVTELTYAGVIIQARAFSAIEIFVPIAAGYVLIALSFTQVSRWLERRFRLLHA
jgi:polar amino acid transport system permease protein